MDYKQLKECLSALSRASLQTAIQAINFHLTLRNWLFGRYIVEYEQNGKDRAKYGQSLLKKLAKDLSKQMGKGASDRSLYKMVLFFRTYPISPTVSAKSLPVIAQTVSAKSSPEPQKLLEFAIEPLLKNQDEPSVYFIRLCKNLTWSHFVELLRIADTTERQFYEVETLQNKWSVREMKRQIDSQLFTRVGLSKDKEKVLQMAKTGQVVESPKDIIKDPFVFEFLGLPEDSFTESDLEQAIINNLQAFLLEMGRGFCFVARQKRITFNTKHYYIDLLLFHRKLRSLIAIDLKIGEFDHADAGQMNFYLNYLKREEVEKGENPPIGIILCASKDQAFVEFALGGLDNSVFVSEYQVYLPTKQELQELIEKTKRDSGLLLPDNLGEKPVTTLRLPKRIITCLQSAGIDTIAKLVAKNEDELLKIKRFGLVSLQAVKTKLEEVGLKLAGD
jgi:predicted nuclease of restriction endonuclease-like (RecB) superfamily